jgi:hypothetical protein
MNYNTQNTPKTIAISIWLVRLAKIDFFLISEVVVIYLVSGLR